jgi:nitrite reductase/ring-hydroxylating ferredoxin subunit
MSERKPDENKAQAEPVFLESPWAKYAHCRDADDFVSCRELPHEADDSISRRELLTFTIFTSGTLFAGTVGLAVLGRMQQPDIGDMNVILPISELPEEGQAYHFYYPRPNDEAVLLHLRGRGLVAYSRRCTHLGCTVVYEPDYHRLFCPCHLGVFDPFTGVPVAGPPERRLPRILIEIKQRMLIATGIAS